MPTNKDDPQRRLEAALGSIAGIARVLGDLATTNGSAPLAKSVDYLCTQLERHHAEAWDAYTEIYKLDAHREPRAKGDAA